MSSEHESSDAERDSAVAVQASSASGSPEPVGEFALPGDASRVRTQAEEMDRISGSLEKGGALAVVLVDATSLESIERGYGVPAHRNATLKLQRLVEGACREQLDDGDLIVSSERAGDELLVLLFRRRGDSEFYCETLPALAASLADVLKQNGGRIVYPYDRSAPALPVGHAFVLHNPGLRAERQVHEALERARQDADLNARIDARERMKGFSDLLLAEDVTILYEPITNITTREVRGYEGLVRGPWDTEMHAPGQLFGVAEETGLLFELDCLCRRIALRGARGLQPGKLLFLNCLPTAIHDPAFRGDVLRQTLEDLRLRPSDVVFEISERESIHNFDVFREARDYYSELGFKIALDDTGVAYGSLQAVMELSPDFIKVDLSLVRGIDTDPPRQELLRALNSVAGKINAEIIAEGIETSEELETLQGLGIPYGQGYLFGRAAPLRRAR
jgi:EAL domain-containing protein (putative c-di-GMP-specific phosphodiesterase class I)